MKRTPTKEIWMFFSLCFMTLAFIILFLLGSYNDISLESALYFLIPESFGSETEGITCDNHTIHSYPVMNLTGNLTSIDTKRILLWTPYFGQPLWWYTMGTSRFNKLKCPYQCSITNDKSEVCSSDAVLAHMRDIGTLPRQHPSNQIWILFTMESPQNTYSGLDLVKMDNKFDWITSYRRDSDIPSAYGITKRKPNPVEMNTNFSQQGRQKKALIFLTNCVSHRYYLVKRLQQLYPVDIYGYCGKPDPCNREADCVKKLVKGYKYFLAFENTECKDYITEKFWIAFQWDILPIVKGASFEAYNASGPPNSFLHMDQFKTPAALAKHLQYLDENDQEYDRYFTWKKTHEVYIHMLDLYDCKLCEAIHKNVLPRKTKVLSQWWSRDQCKDL